MMILEGKRTVLVIEDNELNRNMLVDILSGSYTVLQAENGKEGLEIFKEYGSKISLVLLDIRMPVMDGYEFLKAVQNMPHFANIPIIVTTASNETEDQILCLEKGASDFVSKPYNPEIVLKRVESLIRLSESSAMLSKLEYDALTGLYNKEFFYNHADRILNSMPNMEFDALCCEIASLKILYDRFDAKMVEKLLINIADNIKREFKDTSVCGRISDDTFAIICSHHTLDEYKKIADNIAVLSDSPVHSTNIHFGICFNVPHSLAASSICNNAMLAIEEINHRYGINIAVYDESTMQKILHEQLLLENMDAALEQKQFHIYYQPNYRFKHEKIGGAEALTYWDNPKMGLLPPGEFLPIFEKNGVIDKLDKYVFEEVCRQQREWMDAGIAVMPVSVKISLADFEHNDLAQIISSVADKYGVPHNLIHIEVTESAYIDNPAQINMVIKSLKEYGFFIELGDFGSGYCSLGVLSSLRPDTLKFDMSLIRNIHSNMQRKILNHVINMTYTLGIESVAKGIETDEQLLELRKMGCTYGQGDFLSKPVTEKEFEKLLRDE